MTSMTDGCFRSDDCSVWEVYAIVSGRILHAFKIESDAVVYSRMLPPRRWAIRTFNDPMHSLYLTA